MNCVGAFAPKIPHQIFTLAPAPTRAGRAAAPAFPWGPLRSLRATRFEGAASIPPAGEWVGGRGGKGETPLRFPPSPVTKIDALATMDAVTGVHFHGCSIAGSTIGGEIAGFCRRGDPGALRENLSPPISPLPRRLFLSSSPRAPPPRAAACRPQWRLEDLVVVVIRAAACRPQRMVSQALSLSSTPPPIFSRAASRHALRVPPAPVGGARASHVPSPALQHRHRISSYAVPCSHSRPAVVIRRTFPRFPPSPCRDLSSSG
jgi:hypothetical protein